MKAAVAAEDFHEAARLRDELQQLSMDSEASLLCANSEFYAAFQTCDSRRMASIWLPESRSCCVHPGSAPVHGYDAVVSSWHAILRGRSGMDLDFFRPSVVVRGDVGRVVCFERLDSKLAGTVALVAVNLFERTDAGWKIWYHQAGMTDSRALLAEEEEEE